MAAAWQRSKELFAQALEADAAGRAQLLARLAREEPAQLAPLERLLAAHDAADELLERGALAALPGLAEELTSPVGLRFGPYRVLSELGRGGMGAVYLAVRDDDSFEQKVAIKRIQHGLASEEVLARFAAERQILAALVHPNIARLLDGGSATDGSPYLVMEAIAGRRITVYAADEELALEARLRLFVQVCGAVQFAHQNLVVHRDLKPANILVDAEGVPKLLDFGIAKLLAGPARPGSDLTRLGGRPLTPDYASPEQLTGDPVTTATDVYLLGLLLYELLVGRSRAEAVASLGESWVERLPSAVLIALGPARGLQHGPRRLVGDLDTIVGRALEREPRRRYGTAAELAEDVERFLGHLPVRARRPSLPYRLSRLVRRHRLATAFAATLLVALGIGTWQAFEIARQRDRAAEGERRAQGLSRFLIGLFRVSDPGQSRGAAVTARELLDAGAEQLLAPTSASRRRPGSFVALGEDPATRAELLGAVGEIYGKLGLREDGEAALRRALELLPAERTEAQERARAALLLELAALLREGGATAEARRCLDEVLATRARLEGRRSTGYAAGLDGLGQLAQASGDLPTARTALGEAIALYRAAGEPAELALAESLSNLASVEVEAGASEAAAALLDEALGLHRRLLGEDHPQIAEDLSALAGMLHGRGDYAGAAARFEAALALRRRLLPADHPDIAVTLSNLATSRYESGDLEGAEAAARSSLELQRGQLAAGSPDLATALNNLAAIVRERGGAAEAVALYEESLALYRALAPPRDDLVGTALNNLALARRDQGELALAERLAREGLAHRVRAGGADSLAVAGSVNTLASLLQRAGRAREAEAAYREALALRRKLLPPGHPTLAFSLVGLGLLLTEQGRAAEALPLLLEGLELRERALPPGHSLRLAAERALASCRAQLDVG
jgi:eukaryotic-like serine/threonine-protein kinase